jgi:nicotinate-nucleotide pyrophosphorylase (carboxylating)
VKDLNALALDALYAELTRDRGPERLVDLAYEEDLGPGGVPGDVTSAVCIDARAAGRALVVARGAGVLAGVRCLPTVLSRFAPDVALRATASDGQRVARGDRVAELSGPMRQILAAERTLLNLLGRLSGVATRTAAFVAKVQGTGAQLLDTRKTTPGLRNLEKYAVRCGGGYCHRVGLYDAVLIKDNHLAGVGTPDLARVVAQAAARARELAAAAGPGGGLRFVELEVDSLEQFDAVLRAGLCGPGKGVDVVLLDNMPPERLREAVVMRTNYRSSVLLEASGGVTMETVRAIAETGVDRISVGGLTHHAVSLDVALDVE